VYTLSDVFENCSGISLGNVKLSLIFHPAIKLEETESEKLLKIEVELAEYIPWFRQWSEKEMVTYINISKFNEKGAKVYEKLKPELEEKHKGMLVAIEVDSSDYFVGESVTEARKFAQAKYPDKIFYIVRPGYKAVGRIPLVR